MRFILDKYGENHYNVFWKFEAASNGVVGMRTGPNIRKRADGRFEARYIKARNENGKIIYGFCYGKTYDEAKAKRDAAVGSASDIKCGPRQMNLLILGAGGQGHVVKEAAESLNIFEKISFLDDDPDNRLAVGPCNDYLKYIDEYPAAFVSFGKNDLRLQWVERLEKAGFILPRIVHRDASVSPSAIIGSASIVEAKANVSANVSVGKGCIVSSGAIIDHDAILSDCCHIDCGAMVKSKYTVDPLAKIASGVIAGAETFAAVGG